MRVVPGSAVEISGVSIGHTFPGCDGTLLNGRDTIVPRSRLLQESMPVERSTFLRTDNVVADSGRDGIAPIDFNRRSRECSIDKQSATVHTVRGNKATGDIEIVTADDACMSCQRR